MVDKKKILIVAPPFIPTSKDSVAGTEQMVYLLDSSLEKLGYDVYTVAREDSKIEGTLVPGIIDHESYSGAALEHYYQGMRNTEAVVRKFIRDTPDLSVIVDRCLGASLPVSIEESGPTVICGLDTESKYFWSPSLFKEMRKYIKKRKDSFASPSQYIANSYLEDLDFSGFEDRLSVIPNGIAVDNFDFSNNHDDYLMFMGRMVERKGLHHAMMAARDTGHKLLVVGPNPEEFGDSQYADDEYYNEKIKPLISDNVEFYGSAGLKDKVELLGNAKALLFPSQTEPFGLVPVEAMACGTPVIAFDRGGPQETIVHGKTGFLAKDYSELVFSVDKIGDISRDDCRKHVENNYSAAVFGGKFADLIERVS